MESTDETEPCCPQHGLESLGHKLRRVKEDVDIQKHQIHRLKGEVREHFQQVAEDLHEVRSIQREKAVAKENRRREQAHAIQNLMDRMAHVEIQVGTMVFEARVHNKLESNREFVDRKRFGTSLRK